MRVLVGDIGGTKTVLAVAETVGDRVAIAHVRRYASREYAVLEAICHDYLSALGPALAGGCERAAFAVAGPVLAGRSQTTNLPWVLESVGLGQALGLRQVCLLNDLEALAWGVAALPDAELAVLHPGDPAAVGNACVVAAGTGLGQAGMYWDGARHHPFATEGGHGDFAPSGPRELALHEQLASRYGHVSWERLVSGPGIVHIYAFLTGAAGVEPPAWLRQQMEAGDAAAAIAAAAGARRCPVCVEAMALFFRLYGREAGNAALKHMALGGVYLGGGIAPQHLEALRTGPFLEAFFAKGRMTALMQRMPVKVILSAATPLYGAARYLALAAEGQRDSG